MQKDDIGHMLLLLGLAFVFIYFGIDKFVHPEVWIGWMPPQLNGLAGMSSDLWLQVTGAAEVIIGVLILFPMRFLRKLGLALAVLHLIAVLTQTGWNDIAVRDIGLLALAIGTWFLL